MLRPNSRAACRRCLLYNSSVVLLVVRSSCLYNVSRVYCSVYILFYSIWCLVMRVCQRLRYTGTVAVYAPVYCTSLLHLALVSAKNCEKTRDDVRSEHVRMSIGASFHTCPQPALRTALSPAGLPEEPPRARDHKKQLLMNIDLHLARTSISRTTTPRPTVVRTVDRNTRPPIDTPHTLTHTQGHRTQPRPASPPALPPRSASRARLALSTLASRAHGRAAPAVRRAQRDSGTPRNAWRSLARLLGL